MSRTTIMLQEDSPGLNIVLHRLDGKRQLLIVQPHTEHPQNETNLCLYMESPRPGESPTKLREVTPRVYMMEGTFTP